MKITQQNTDEAVLIELGARLARTRLDRNLTQGQLAAEAGVGRATLERMEAGRSARLPSLIRVLRVLDLLDGLDRLVPESTPSPLELLELRGKQRRRAAPAKHVEGPDAWTWGDEPTERSP
jgi:transcriptional regulator with XRE-family HTH domain